MRRLLPTSATLAAALTLLTILASPSTAFTLQAPFASSDHTNPSTPAPPPPRENGQPNRPQPRSPETAYPPPTWDNASLFLLGERAMLFGGEFHPFRLPVPSLWRDVLEKARAAGLAAVSFHVAWALLEGGPGEFRADGVFALDALFDAARDAGLWLVARPGPYIQSEVTGGGLPGWIQRIKGHPRTADEDYLAATDNYASNIAAIIAKAQISNGGKVILYQPENGYSASWTLNGFNFPDPGYMQYIMDQARNAGIVVPFINNDNWLGGHNAPGTGVGEVDLYGHALFPLDFDCRSTDWNLDAVRTTLYSHHVRISPSTPYAIPDFQGGQADYWGGAGFARCAERYNHEQTRVFYKNNLAAGVRIFNVYMLYGGTNWGNLGYDSGYTSYDYGAAIAEDRTVAREKYSELKLLAHFLRASPGYLEATPDLAPTAGVYTPEGNITVTAVAGPRGSFFVTRKTRFGDPRPLPYTLSLPTSRGRLAIPRLGGALTMPGRDTRIHVTDYPVGDSVLVYCTAEVFTWQAYEGRTVLVLYGDAGETHELLLRRGHGLATAITEGVKTEEDGSYLYAQWTASKERQTIRAGTLYIYLVDRNAAYDFWVTDLPRHAPLIISGGYLIRSAALGEDGILAIRADFNRSAALEIMGVPTGAATALTINGADVPCEVTGDGDWLTPVIGHTPPRLGLPDLAALDWHYRDALPELQEDYSDEAWPAADHAATNNTFVQAPLTPTSLYASDYAFHAGGALLFRGHFKAKGNERKMVLRTQGGAAFAALFFLNGTHLGSWPGSPKLSAHRDVFATRLAPGWHYVLTVLLDNMGNAHNGLIGGDAMKAPRGILEYGFELIGGEPPAVEWKVTGNLGGESYVDKARGPLNEGGLFVERMGFHLPSPPLDGFEKGRTPMDGIDGTGVGFWTAEMRLDIPSDMWDVPLSFEFPAIDPVAASGRYRAMLWVNGFQFGRYISHMGPQTSFPVPEGILNYRGNNTIAVALWAFQSRGARISSLTLKAGTPVLTGRSPVVNVVAPAWTERPGAY